MPKIGLIHAAVLTELRLVIARHRHGAIASTRRAGTLLHPFNGLFSRTTWVSQYEKRKTSLDLDEARDGGVLGCSGISCTI